MRDLLIIIGMCIAAIAVGTWLYFYVPFTEFASPQPTEIKEASAEVVVPESTPVSFVEIAHGSNATGITVRKNYAIYSADEFAKIWKQTGSTQKIPTVDFTKNYVIAVFAGTVSTSGYSISVVDVTDTQDSRSVGVHISKPGKGCVVTEAQSHPYQIIIVPVSVGSLSHTDTESSVDCSAQ